MTEDEHHKPGLPGRKVTRAEALAIAGNVMLEAERRRDEAAAEEAQHYDPPYPHELVARLREMAADHAAATAMCIWQGPTRENKTAMRALVEKYWPLRDSALPVSMDKACREWVLSYTRPAADLLAILEGRAE